VFTVSIRKQQRKEQDYSTKLREYIDQLKKGMPGDTGGVDVLGDKLSGQIKFGEVVRALEKDGGDIRAVFAEALSNAAQDEGRHNGEGVFDFTDSGAAIWLKDRLKKFAIGNERDAEIERLIVDVNSASVSVDAILIHKHRLSKAEILDALKTSWAKTDEQFNNALKKLNEKCKSFSENCNKMTHAIKLDSQMCRRTFEAKPLEPRPDPVASLAAGTGLATDRRNWRSIDYCPVQNYRLWENDFENFGFAGDGPPAAPEAFYAYPWPPKAPYTLPLTLAESVKLHLAPPVALETELSERKADIARRRVAILVPKVVDDTFDVVTQELLRCNHSMRLNMDILLKKKRVFALRFVYETTTDSLLYRDVGLDTPAAHTQFLSLALSAILTTAGLHENKIFQAENKHGVDIILRSKDHVLAYTRRISDTGLIRPSATKISKVVETLYFGHVGRVCAPSRRVAPVGQAWADVNDDRRYSCR